MITCSQKSPVFWQKKSGNPRWPTVERLSSDSWTVKFIHHQPPEEKDTASLTPVFRCQYQYQICRLWTYRIHVTLQGFLRWHADITTTGSSTITGNSKEELRHYRNLCEERMLQHPWYNLPTMDVHAADLPQILAAEISQIVAHQHVRLLLQLDILHCP